MKRIQYIDEAADMIFVRMGGDDGIQLGNALPRQIIDHSASCGCLAAVNEDGILSTDDEFRIALPDIDKMQVGCIGGRCACECVGEGIIGMGGR